MAEFQTPRGTQDRLPEQQADWELVLSAFWQRFGRAGFGRLDTPLFEDSALFERAVGRATDIGANETYSFADKSGDRLTLRPEGTAPVVRAYIQHGMASRPQPARLAYYAPLFRYDRPQAGRLRQHHQMGAELLGEQDPHADAELISQIWLLLRHDLGLDGLTLQLNSIGRPGDRVNYLTALKAHLAPRASGLSEESRRRLEQNPLRILDSKDPRDQAICHDAPHTIDYLGRDSARHFKQLTSALTELGISFQSNFRLVRGLDYYTDTVFEIWPADSAGQATIAGGGRYDLLAGQLGGPTTPGVGFGCGIERVLINLAAQRKLAGAAPRVDVYLAPLSPAARSVVLALAGQLRDLGLIAIAGYAAASPRSHLRKANAQRARWAVIVGDNELQSETLALRDLDAASQQVIDRSELVPAIRALLN